MKTPPRSSPLTHRPNCGASLPQAKEAHGAGGADWRGTRLARSQRGLHQRRLLFIMRPCQPGGRARGGLSTDIDWALRLVIQLAKHRLEAPIDEVPGAHIIRLLLAPNHIGVP